MPLCLCTPGYFIIFFAFGKQVWYNLVRIFTFKR